MFAFQDMEAHVQVDGVQRVRNMCGGVQIVLEGQ